MQSRYSAQRVGYFNAGAAAFLSGVGAVLSSFFAGELGSGGADGATGALEPIETEIPKSRH